MNHADELNLVDELIRSSWVGDPMPEGWLITERRSSIDESPSATFFRMDAEKWDGKPIRIEVWFEWDNLGPKILNYVARYC